MSEQTDNRQLDALIAKFMGWKESPASNYEWQLSPPDENITVVRCVPHFSSDIACAMQVEERIKELGLHQQYAAALAETVHNPVLSYPDLFAVIHASARDRCLAARAVVEGVEK